MENLPLIKVTYPDKRKPEWLYTLQERFTTNSQQNFGNYCASFDSYRASSGFHHITELVTLDSLMCPNIIGELRAEDWKYNVKEDFRTELFRNVDYLLLRQPLDASKHQIIAALECPPAQFVIPNGFTVCGYDIMDSSFGNSTLTNCGPIPDAFKPTDVNNFGLIDDQDKAFAIRDTMRTLYPDCPHLGDCEVWLLARRLLDVGE